MKKFYLKIVSLLLFLFLPLSIVNADSYFKTNGSNEEVYHSLFTAGETISANDKVNGINFVAGSTINSKGYSEYGAFAGRDIIVNGTVDKDLFAAGSSIILEPDFNLGRDAYIAGATITINNTIKGNLFLAGDIVTLKNTTIDGDVRIAGSNLNIEGNVEIKGTLYVNEEAKILNEDNLKVQAKEIYKSENISGYTDFFTKNTFLFFIIGLASLMIIAFIINVIFPKVYEKANKDVSFGNIAKNILLGLVLLIMIPIISVLLLIIPVTTILSVIILLAYVIALLISMAIASMTIGNIVLTKLFKKDDNSYLSITIGTILIEVISIIPYCGGIVCFLLFLFGLGKIGELFKGMKK